MRKLLWSVAVVGLGFFQIAQSQDLSKPGANAEASGLPQLHERLRNPKGDSHDDYGSAIYIGNEQTVPLLLERLRRDHGATEPTPPPGLKLGFVRVRSGKCF
jgi:hypothetical protein